MDVYLMTAEHWSVPGLVISAHATLDGAIAAAVEAAAIMVNDHNEAHTDGSIEDGFIQPPTAETWPQVVEALQDYHGAQYVYVEVNSLPVQP